MGYWNMNVICRFAIKDFKEIIQSRKILIVCLVSVLYPSIINIVAINPLVPVELAIIPASIFTACVSTEILYFLMINEIRYRIFDIFIVSRMSRIKLLICRITLPVLIAFLFAIISVILNNMMVLVFPNSEYIMSTLNSNIIIIYFVTALISSLLEIGIVIVNSKMNEEKHTLVIAISFLINIILYAIFTNIGMLCYLLVATSIVGLIFLFDYKAINLYNRPTISKNWFNLKVNFPDEKCTSLSGILRKEIRISNLSIFTIINLILVSFFPIFVISMDIRDFELSKFLFRVILYFICYFGVINVLFPVIKEERINRYSDIFLIAKLSNTKYYFSKIIIPITITLFGFGVSFLLTLLFYDSTIAKMYFDSITFLIIIVSSIFSIYICFILSKFINSYQDVRIIMLFIISISFFEHIIFSYIQYLLV